MRSYIVGATLLTCFDSDGPEADSFDSESLDSDSFDSDGRLHSLFGADTLCNMWWTTARTRQDQRQFAIVHLSQFEVNRYD